MIELTVKTLDSQNHQFTVEDDITVEQFKVKIADQVNIPAETQRIIYCGRVLQDSSKLADYDVNGKVVHLVQRPPPSTSPRPNRAGSPPQEPNVRRAFRGYDRGNTMYVGSMAFPGNLMESQGIVPPPPTHSLSGSRLNVARRMLRRAEAVIRLLENPTRANEPPQVEEVQEEEVTPVIEARVIVPSSTSEPIDEAAVLNAVQNSLINATAGALNLGSSSGQGGSGTQANTTNAQASDSSTPEGVTPRSSSTENLASDSRPESNGLPENASRGTEMAELLTMLGQLQTRFAPFLERYQTFMQEDPEVPVENERQTQTMLNQVSEVLHFLGHAYHSLSDIIIRVRNPPPRPLLCRPILIQHSAVVQTGIPIQVEAQINLSADRPPNPPNGASTGGNNDSQTNNTSANGTAPGATAPNTGSPTISVQQGFVGLPFMPSGSMRVITTPVEIRAMRTNGIGRQNNNNNTVNAAGNTAPSAPPPYPATTQADGSNPAGDRGGNTFQLPNNSNVEFFMEVTPEGITIDSLETTLVGSNQAANEFLRGALNGPPPEFLQSLMQIVNSQIINRTAGSVPATVITASSTDSTQSTVSSPTSTGANGTGQNSQARGNTATNPTTATHTRSTPRPHVHMTQQAMQGGFDPFLPCNSHHISRRRQVVPTAVVQNVSNQSATRQEATAGSGNRPAGTRQGGQQQNIQNFLRSFYDTLGRSTQSAQVNPQTTTTSTNSSSNQSGDTASNMGTNLPPFAALFSSLGGGNLPDLIRQGPTLDQILQLQLEETDGPDEVLVYDLIMLLARNLTLVDVFAINSGNMEPINRNRTAIQEYFRTRICEDDISPAGIGRGVDRIITFMRPFIESFNTLPVRDNIDVSRSLEMFFRRRTTDIIRTAVNLNSNNVGDLIDQVTGTIKQLLSLTLNICSTGQQGVEQFFERFLSQAMQGIPQDIRNWTLATSRTHLRQLMSNLTVPVNEIEQFVVHGTQSVPSPVQEFPMSDLSRPDHGTLDLTAEVESMDVEELTPTNEEVHQINTPPLRMEEAEPLPNIVLGSEPWHAQVPEDWVPIITRDAQKQRRQNPQGPFSDAYLSGMPSKRRKLINSSKPQGSLPQVISESVRQAVTATGLASAAPLETVATAAGSSPEIQAAYRTLLRSTVQANLRDNEDFTPDRFPNASNYFINSPPQ